MNLKDVYDQLAFGELSNVVFGKRIEGDQGIENANLEKIFPHVKLGLTDLHKRFLLREESMLLDIVADQSTYMLTMDFSQANPKAKGSPQFIADTDNPFTDNLFKVERVEATLHGKVYPVPLNMLDRADGIRTPQYNALTVPTSSVDAPWLAETSQMKVYYRADHPVIRDFYANSSPLTTPLYLPPTHLWALCLFIASRAHNSIGIAGNTDFHEGNNYYSKYEVEIAKLKQGNYEIDTNTDGAVKFAQRGFV